MSKIKGRQLGFLFVLFGGWGLARVIILSGIPSSNMVIATKPNLPIAAASAPVPQSSFLSNIRQHASPKFQSAQDLRQWPASRQGYAKRPQLRRTGNVSGPPQSRDQNMAKGLASFLARQQPPTYPPENPPFGSGVMPVSGTPAKQPLFRGYAFSFWRRSAQVSGLAAGGQYGGGQTGLIASFPLDRIGKDRLAIMVRGVVAHDDWSDREVALGLQWRPFRKIPITLTAERRFRPVARDRFSAYLAGGIDGITLPVALKLDAYAQTGIVSGPNAGPFFDASGRAYRTAFRSDMVSARLGGGVWAGGQRGAARLDIGPSIKSDFSVGETRLAIAADWRFRVAGDAIPGNGPGLTLSASF